MSPRVAIITYHYPPNRTIGALRLAKFAKYLPEFGWEPLVITVTPGSQMYLRAGALRDELTQGDVVRTRDWSLHALVARLRPAVALGDHGGGSRHPSRASGWITRAAVSLYRNTLCFPDECWPWLASVPAITRVVAHVRPDALLSSSPPGTAHVIAARVAGRFAIPWVADFRDPWSQSHHTRRAFPLNRIERRLEQRVIRRAAALTAVSRPIVEQLEGLHGKPSFVVMNGHDDEHPEPVAHPAHGSAPFTLVHTGLLYPVTRDPAPIFAAFRELLEDGTIARGNCILRFLGRNLGVARKALDAYPDVAPLVEFGGEVARDEALAQQQRATALLLLEWPDRRARGVLTGKLFEYLGAGRPILAVAPKDGEIQRVIGETAGGEVVTSAAEATAVLGRWIRSYRDCGSAAAPPEPETLRRYSRREQTRILAGVLDRVVTG